MKKIILVLLLAGCATVPPTRQDKTRQLFCYIESCPAFAQQHNYTVLESHYRDGACVCKLMSDNSPDSFEVTIPLGADAGGPVTQE